MINVQSFLLIRFGQGPKQVKSGIPGGGEVFPQIVSFRQRVAQRGKHAAKGGDLVGGMIGQQLLAQRVFPARKLRDQCGLGLPSRFGQLDTHDTPIGVVALPFDQACLLQLIDGPGGGGGIQLGAHPKIT